MRFLKGKILLLLAALVLVMYLTNDFSLIDIKETALIVALGVDKEGDQFEVSAQIAIPQATDQTASNSSAVLSGKGKTVAQAIENIGVRTGWYPKLSFCNVIFIGSGVLDRDVMYCLDYFLRSNRIQDTAELCACTNTAKEILTAKSPLDELSAFSVLKILQEDAENSSTVTFSSLREFAMGYFNRSGFAAMPVVELKEADQSGGENKGNQPTSKRFTESQSSPEQGEQKEKAQIFDATKTMLFDKGVKKLVLDKEQTIAYNVLKRSINETSIELDQIEYNGERAALLLAIRNNRSTTKLTIKNSRPTLDISLRITARIDDTDVTSSPAELAKGYVVPDDILTELEAYLKDKITEIFNKAKESGCDIFEVKERLYRTKNDYYEGLKKIILNETELNVKVKAKSFR